MGGRKISCGAVALAGLVAAATTAPVGASPVAEPPAVWAMNADGTDQHVVAADTDWDPAPAWSPDGRFLAYTTDDGKIAVVGSDGATPAVKIADGALPDWSPDGSLIAFARTPMGDGAPGTLAVVRPDGSGLTDVVDMVARGPVAWSPDGSLIAYHRCDETPCRHSLAVVRPDGTDASIVAAADYTTDPSWAPDGSAVAFTAHGDVWVAPLTGGGPVRNLTPGSDFGTFPDWGAGGRIAYSGDLGRTYVVDPDGTDKAFVHEGGSPAWSPDGTRLLLSLQGELILKAPGTAGAPNVTNSDEREYRGVWSPDGGRIAYLLEPASGPPSQRHGRSASASLSGGVVLGKLRVVDGFSACVYRMPVLLQRFGRRGWSTVDEGKTGPRGRFEFELGRREGLYRVRAPRSWAQGQSYDLDECVATSTPPLRYRRQG